jgi:hypothetical protein
MREPKGPLKDYRQSAAKESLTQSREPIGGMTDPEKSKATTEVSQEVKPVAMVRPREATPSKVDMRAYIGKQLQAVYDEILRQPVPDRFKDLLKELDVKREND